MEIKTIDYLIILGAAITIIGLIGISYCGFKAFKARQLKLEGQDLVVYLQALIPVNLTALLLSVIGLVMVTIGVIF